MKLLLDSCIWTGTRPELEAAGHDVLWAGDWVPDPGDEEILARAHREGRVVVTLDRDFGELAVARNAPHSGILRLVKIPFQEHGRVIMQVVQSHESALRAGAIVTASTTRVRIRSSGAQSD